MFKRLFPYIFICLLLAGCGIKPITTVPSTKGEVTIQTTSIPTDNSTNWTVHVVLTRGKHELKEVLEVNGDKFMANMSVPAGTWDISLHLVDADGVVSYQDTLKDVTIHPHKNTELNFQLKPANGEIQLLVDLSSYPDSDQILRVRVHFNDQVKEITRAQANEELIGEYSLPPGSYDFKVELFTSSFRAGDKVDPGVWQTIHIEPLDQQVLTWAPFMKELTISANILTIPEAPSNIQATYNQDHVTLEWLASSSTNVTAYQIYCQTTPFEPFELLATVNATTKQFNHELSEIENLPDSINYCIEAIADDIVGYRSPIVELKLR